MSRLRKHITKLLPLLILLLQQSASVEESLLTTLQMHSRILGEQMAGLLAAPQTHETQLLLHDLQMRQHELQLQIDALINNGNGSAGDAAWSHDVPQRFDAVRQGLVRLKVHLNQLMGSAATPSNVAQIQHATQQQLYHDEQQLAQAVQQHNAVAVDVARDFELLQRRLDALKQQIDAMSQTVDAQQQVIAKTSMDEAHLDGKKTVPTIKAVVEPSVGVPFRWGGLFFKRNTIPTQAHSNSPPPSRPGFIKRFMSFVRPVNDQATVTSGSDTTLLRAGELIPQLQRQRLYLDDVIRRLEIIARNDTATALGN